STCVRSVLLCLCCFSFSILSSFFFFFFFFIDPAPTEIYTLSLHDALPILAATIEPVVGALLALLLFSQRLTGLGWLGLLLVVAGDRKSTRLNSSHLGISYAVFCLKKKKNKKTNKSPLMYSINRRSGKVVYR